MKDLKSIKSKKEYKIVLNRIYDLMQKDLKINSEEYNELDVLSILVENYESKSFPIDLPDIPASSLISDFPKTAKPIYYQNKLLVLTILT